MKPLMSRTNNPSRLRLSRRGLLASMATAAGALVLKPFYQQLAHAQGATPKRFLFIVEGNGFEPVTMLSNDARTAYNAQNARQLTSTSRFWPTGYSNAGVIETTAPTLTTAPALSGLQTDLVDKSLCLFGLSSKVSGGGHNALHGCLSSSKSVGGRAASITIDALLGADPAIRQDTPIDVLRVGVLPGKVIEFNLCAYGAGRPAPMFVDPTASFNTLFSSVASAADQEQFANRRRILDFAVEDVNTALASFSGNSAERQKLETYLASLEEMIARQTRITQMQATLQAVRPELPTTNPLYLSGDVLDQFRAQLELIKASFVGGLTNIAVLGMGPGGGLGMTYESVLPGVSRHDLHHQSGSNPTYLQAIHDVTRLQVDAIANFARALEQTPDVSGGSMLENTVIVFIGDNGEQHHSTASDFPTLLIGGSNMGLVTGGRTLMYPGLSQSNHRQVSNLWNTIGHLAGIDLNDFGKEGPSRVALGPLAELMT